MLLPTTVGPDSDVLVLLWYDIACLCFCFELLQVVLRLALFRCWLYFLTLLHTLSVYATCNLLPHNLVRQHSKSACV